jgi:hypothetical protein
MMHLVLPGCLAAPRIVHATEVLTAITRCTSRNAPTTNAKIMQTIFVIATVKMSLSRPQISVLLVTLKFK